MKFTKQLGNIKIVVGSTHIRIGIDRDASFNVATWKYWGTRWIKLGHIVIKIAQFDTAHA